MSIPRYNLPDLFDRVERLERVVAELAEDRKDHLSPFASQWLVGQTLRPEPGEQAFVPNLRDLIAMERDE